MSKNVDLKKNRVITPTVKNNISDEKSNSNITKEKEKKLNVKDIDPTELLGNAEEKGKPFRIQNIKLHLTYKTHIDPETWVLWLKNKLTSTELKEYSIVNEKSVKKGYLHTHCLIRFTKKLDIRDVRYFDYENLHPNIGIIKTVLHWNRCISYHYKDGVPVSTIPSRTIVEETWSYDSTSDAILNVCSSLKDIGGAIAAFSHKKIDYGKEPDVTWLPWQKSLYDELGGTPDPRKITWFWDQTGNSGKTYFTKHMGMYKDAFVSTRANVYHVATQLQEVVEQGGSVLIVIFNFTRQCENKKIYEAIESLKDGLVTSEKYKGKTLFLPVPHVVIFANYIPDFSKVSLDRWDLRKIKKDGTIGKYDTKDIKSWLDNRVSGGMTLNQASIALSVGITEEKD